MDWLEALVQRGVCAASLDGVVLLHSERLIGHFDRLVLDALDEE